MSPTFLIVDLFCGAGGTTTGFDMTDGLAEVIACVNHDAKAIRSHAANYPNCKHFTEDIRTLDLTELVRIVAHYRNLYPDAKLILWASLECTNFSKAKGGQPRDADSRTLADHLDRYILALNPDYVQIENVVEFMCWGPLDDNGKPISRKNGQDWNTWRNRIDTYGYYNEWKELNSANFGAYTSRNRLFGCFAKHGMPIAWPEPTHAKNPNSGTLYEAPMKKWKAVKDVLDFTDEGKSIFEREKPLSEKTMERIYAGLIKFVAGGKDSFLLKYNSTDKSGKHYPPSTDEPCPVITTQSRLGIVAPSFISKYYSGRPEGKNISVEGPAGTITCVDSQALVQTSFIHAYYGNGENNHSINSPAPTLTTKDRGALVNPIWIDEQYGTGSAKSADLPAGTLTTTPKLNIVQVQPFVMGTHFNNQPTSIEEPAPTITANRKWSYLVNPSWGGNPGSTDEPSPVIIARQDKAPMYLVVSDAGELAIQIYETDSECTKRIKEFMALYGIVDIKMRMLKVSELLKIQGFPEGYKLDGNQSDQKKFIGNSVVPQVVKAWAIAMANKLTIDKAA